MTDQALVLCVGRYEQAQDAHDDLQGLKTAQADGLTVRAAVLLHREANGRLKVTEEGLGTPVSGAAIGGTVGLVIGLLAPPLLISAAVGAGIGATAGKLAKSHEERALDSHLDGNLPPGQSAVFVVAEAAEAQRIEAALTRANGTVRKSIDAAEYQQLVEAVHKGGDQMLFALGTLNNIGSPPAPPGTDPGPNPVRDSH